MLELRKSLFTVLEGNQDSAISRAASSPEDNSDPDTLSPMTPVDIDSDKFSHLVQNQLSDVSELSRYKSTVENVNIKQQSQLFAAESTNGSRVTRDNTMVQPNTKSKMNPKVNGLIQQQRMKKITHFVQQDDINSIRLLSLKKQEI